MNKRSSLLLALLLAMTVCGASEDKGYCPPAPPKPKGVPTESVPSQSPPVPDAKFAGTVSGYCTQHVAARSRKTLEHRGNRRSLAIQAAASSHACFCSTFHRAAIAASKIAPTTRIEVFFAALSCSRCCRSVHSGGSPIYIQVFRPAASPRSAATPGIESRAIGGTVCSFTCCKREC